MSEPRIIIWDLETGPDLKEALKVWTQLSNYYGQTLKAQTSSILCFGWKIFGQHEKARVKCVTDFQARKNINDDYLLVKFIKETLEDADAIVTQNGKKFDLPFLQTRLLRYGLEPLDPKIPHIDLKRAMKRHLYLTSNSLGNAGEFLVGDKKMDHEGWNLWVRSICGDKAALREMAAYCKQDVLLTEKLYRKLRPFLGEIPNHNLFGSCRKDKCPACGSTRLTKNGTRRTKTLVYTRLHCQDCGSSSRTDGAGRNPR